MMMLEPGDILARLATRWTNQWTTWLGGGGTWPLPFGLKPPIEQEAQRRWVRVQAWRSAWHDSPLGGAVAEVTRSWPGLGQQRLPSSVSFASPMDVAAALGKTALFAQADARYRERAEAWPDLSGPLRAIAEWMAGLHETDYRRFVRVVDWLSVNKDSQLYLRQLPIEGLDTKWIERHATPVARLLSVRFGAATASLAVVAGLKSPPSRRRIRLLDPALRVWARGMSDIDLPLADLRSLDIPTRLALVVENNISAQACTDLPGTVLIMGGGFAVTELGSVPWLDRIPILYWGDIDTWGFGILAALRRFHPRTASCLMDEHTLQTHLHLRSDDVPGAPAIVSGLTPEEASLQARLAAGKPWGTGVRLEQERLDWAYAWPVINAAVTRLLDAQQRVDAVDTTACPPA